MYVTQTKILCNLASWAYLNLRCRVICIVVTLIERATDYMHM